MTTPSHYWIGVASRDHVAKGVEGGFCQLCHGKTNPLQRLAPGDWIIYYSPRTQMNTGDPLQAFTAIGQVLAGAPYQVDCGDGFTPYRRNVQFLVAQSAPIRPLLDDLTFIKNKQSWGYAFRFGLLEIPAADFLRIAAAMQVKLEAIV